MFRFIIMKIDYFSDDFGNEIKFYENDKGKMFLQISGEGVPEELSAFFVFSKEDAIDFGKSVIKVAKSLPDTE